MKEESGQLNEQRLKFTERIKKIARREGVDLIGITDLRAIEGIETFPPDLLQFYKYAISLIVSLDRFGFYDNRTEELACEILERASVKIKDFIEKEGYKAKIIPFDKRVEESGPLYWKGEISHKAIAKAAGLGWIGKSTLLITPQYGPRVNLMSILTNIPLQAGKPLMNRCGGCENCIKACPVAALKKSDFYDHPQKLEDCIDVLKCGPYIEKTWEEGRICWECVLACPIGEKSRNEVEKII